MKILLDECVPRPLNQLLSGHECVTVQDRGWTGIRNSELLRRAQEEFDLFITSDQNIRYQQNLAGQKIPILQLSTNDLRRVRAAVALLRMAAESIEKGEFKVVDIP